MESPSRIPDAVSRARLVAYAAEATRQQQRDAQRDLSCKVQYICNDLELILGELQSPAFAAFNETQQDALTGSKAALLQAMRHLQQTQSENDQTPTAK